MHSVKKKVNWTLWYNKFLELYLKKKRLKTFKYIVKIFYNLVRKVEESFVCGVQTVTHTRAISKLKPFSLVEINGSYMKYKYKNFSIYIPV